MTAVLQDRPTPPLTPAARWPRALLALVATLALIVLLFNQTAVAMVGIWWRSETFQHAFLVVPIVLWLVWRDRARLALLRPAPAPLWLLPIAAAAFAWLLGDLGEVNAVTQLAFVALLVMTVPALLGNAVARALMFPLGFLFFAVPLGEFTMPWLMARTADFTVWALQASGIPVFREGQDFVIPSGSWSVVEACSGVRYLIASVMVGTLFAYLNYRSQRRRLIFIGIAILIPVVANWLRAYLIVLLGHLSANRLATGVDHLIYGWLFFAIVMALMFFVGIRWSEPADEALAASRVTHREPATAAAARPGKRPLFFAVAVLVVAVNMLPHQALRLLTSGDNRAAPRLAGFDLAPHGWQSLDTPPAWTPAFVGPSASFAQTWRGPTDTAQRTPVGLSIAYYRDQGDGRKLVSSVNALVATKDKVWRQMSSGTQVVDIGGRHFVVRSARLAGHPGASGGAGVAGAAGVGSAAAPLRVWQFYWVDDELTSNDVAAKAWGVLQRLRHGRDDGAAIMLSTPDDPAAEATLTAFLRDNLGTITTSLTRTRDARETRDARDAR